MAFGFWKEQPGFLKRLFCFTYSKVKRKKICIRVLIVFCLVLLVVCGLTWIFFASFFLVNFRLPDHEINFVAFQLIQLINFPHSSQAYTHTHTHSIYSTLIDFPRLANSCIIWIYKSVCVFGWVGEGVSFEWFCIQSTLNKLFYLISVQFRLIAHPRSVACLLVI